jgi:hypothetical protein
MQQREALAGVGQLDLRGIEETLEPGDCRGFGSQSLQQLKVFAQRDTPWVG